MIDDRYLIRLEEHEKKTHFREISDDMYLTLTATTNNIYELSCKMTECKPMLVLDTFEYNYFIDLDGNIYYLIENIYKTTGENITNKTLNGSKVDDNNLINIAFEVYEIEDSPNKLQLNSLIMLKNYLNIETVIGYNLSEFEIPPVDDLPTTLEEVIYLIRKWAIERSISTASPFKQVVKLGEEFGELCDALIKDDEVALADAIGDMFVVLTIFAQQTQISIEDCIFNAWLEIKDRKGCTKDGIFIKKYS